MRDFFPWIAGLVLALMAAAAFSTDGPTLSTMGLIVVGLALALAVNWIEHRPHH